MTKPDGKFYQWYEGCKRAATLLRGKSYREAENLAWRLYVEATGRHQESKSFGLFSEAVTRNSLRDPPLPREAAWGQYKKNKKLANHRHTKYCKCLNKAGYNPKKAKHGDLVEDYAHKVSHATEEG